MEGNPHLSPSQRGTKIKGHRFLMTEFPDIRISFGCGPHPVTRANSVSLEELAKVSIIS